MLHATVFKDFISIGVTNMVYKIARQMVPKYANDGMDGHEMADFLRNTLSQTTLDAVDMDPESGEFFCYFKLEEPRKVTRNDVHKLRTWLNNVQGDITLAYMKFIEESQRFLIEESLAKAQPEVEFTKEAEDVKDFVLIKGLGKTIE